MSHELCPDRVPEVLTVRQELPDCRRLGRPALLSTGKAPTTAMDMNCSLPDFWLGCVNCASARVTVRCLPPPRKPISSMPPQLLRSAELA